MASERPYSGMGWDDLERLINKARTEYVQQLKLASDELKYRNTTAARVLAIRVQRELDFFVRGGYEQR